MNLPAYSKYAREYGSEGVQSVMNKFSTSAKNRINKIITGINKGVSLFGIQIPTLHQRNNKQSAINSSKITKENYIMEPYGAYSNNNKVSKRNINDTNTTSRFNLINSTLFNTAKHDISRGTREITDKKIKSKRFMDNGIQNKIHSAKENTNRDYSAAGMGLRNLAL